MESLFEKMNGSFSYSLTNGASRLGPVPKVQQAQVALATRSQRGQQSIHNVASKLPNMTSKMKGNKIELNGKIYTGDMFDKLPAGLTLENCATRPTPDGIAFQGHSSPLSNFYPSVIHDVITGQVYNSAGQMYAHKTALAHHKEAIAEHILREKNPSTIKQLSKGLSIGEEWKKSTRTKT